MIRALFTVLLVAWASIASGATFYVSVGGHGETSVSDANPCTGGGGNNAQNILYPKRNLTGASGALNCLASGDQLFVRGGSYDEYIYDYNSNRDIPSGTAGAYTKITAYPGNCGMGGVDCETVWLAPTAVITEPGFAQIVTLGIAHLSQYIEFEGIGLDGRTAPDIGNQPFGVSCDGGGVGGNYLTYKNATVWSSVGHLSPGGPHDFGVFRSTIPGCPGGHRFQHLVIHGGGGQTVTGSDQQSAYLFYIVTDDTIVENCDMSGGRWFGMNIAVTGSSFSGTIVRNNRIHDVNRGAFSGTGGFATAIVIGNGANNIQIYNNLIDNNGNPSQSADNAGIMVAGDSNGALVYYNTIYNTVNGDGIRVYQAATSVTLRNNISYLNGLSAYANERGGEVTQTNNMFIGTDPQFVSTTPADATFLNLAAGSPAIDVGVCLGQVPTDFAGTSRPQGVGCDIGAYEYTAAGTLPGVPTNLIPLSGATGVDLFPTLGFTSTNATAYRFYFSDFNGQSSAFSTDLFDRPPSADLGADWIPYLINRTSAQIVNQHVRTTSTSLPSAERFTARQFASDQWARIRLSTFGTGNVSANLMLRLQNDPQVSGYYIGATKGGTNRTHAYRIENGNFIYLSSEDVTPWASGDLLEAHVVGNVLTIYRNGNTDLRLTAPDPAALYSSGAIGINLFADSIGQVEIDNFEAGDIGPVLVGTFGTPSYAPPALNPNAVYYWRPEGVNAQGATTIPVVSFTTLGTTATPVGIRLRCIYGTANCP